MPAGTFDHALRPVVSELFGNVPFQRTAVDTDPDRNRVYFRTFCNLSYPFNTADIAWIQPYLVDSPVNCFQRQAVIKVNICNQRDGHSLFDFVNAFGRFHVRHRKTDDLPALLFDFMNLFHDNVNIFCFDIRHTLDSDRISAANLQISDLNNFCFISGNHFCPHIFITRFY